MRNKLIVAFLTLIVMIALTPLVFSKLMNNKFNSMILKISQQNGIIIKEIKNKSTYLTTDRVFDIKIPGKLINQNEIKYIEVQTETVFKNLPITDVKFFNTLKKVVLDNNETISLQDIKFLVVTPDFKVYKFKLFDKNIPIENGIVLSWKKIIGTIDLKNNLLKVENGSFDIHDKIESLKIDNIKLLIKESKNVQTQQIHFDAYISNPRTNIEIKQFDIKDDVKIINNKINFTSFISCNKVQADKMLKLTNLKLNFEINGIDKNIFVKLQNKIYTQEDINELLKEGFEGKLNANIKDIFFMQDLGFLDLNSKFSIKNGSLEKLNNNDLSFLNLNISVKTSPNLINVLSNLFPPLRSMVVMKGNQAIINIVINKGNIFVNGKQIKSY